MNSLKDALDSESITESVPDISYRNGFTFSKGVRVAVSFLGAFGILALFSGGAGFILGPLLIFFTAYAHTSTHGTDISLSNNYIRIYSTSFGVKKGKWKPTLLLPDISILTNGKGVRMNPVYVSGSVIVKSTVFEIFLLSANHRKRFLLKECDSKKEAIAVAEELSEKMKKNLVPFNPVISQATMAKRYKRH